MEKFNTFLRLVKTVLVPYLKTGHDSIHMYFFKSVYIYVLQWDRFCYIKFYTTAISFICLLTCVDNKPLKRCKIKVARLLEKFEDAYWRNYISIGMGIYTVFKIAMKIAMKIFFK